MPDYRAIAAQKAREYGIPVDVFLRQIQQESGFNPDAHSSAGADGIAQFIPSTARTYHVNTADPISSLDGAARFDRDLIKRYGSIDRALSAYNSGRPDAYKDPSFAHGQTYNYVRSILGGKTPAAAPAARPRSAVATAAPAASTSTGGISPLLMQIFANNQATIGAPPSLAPLLALALSSKTAAPGDPVTPAAPRAMPTPARGAPVPAGGIAELLHEGVGGPTHSTGEHIHGAFSDPQTALWAINRAQQLGLSVRENPYTDPVDPVHAKNSYHYRTFPGLYHGRKLGEAFDASGAEAAMTQFYNELAKLRR